MERCDRANNPCDYCYPYPNSRAQIEGKRGKTPETLQQQGTPWPLRRSLQQQQAGSRLNAVDLYILKFKQRVQSERPNKYSRDIR